MRGDVYMSNVTKAVIETASLNLRGTLIDDGWFQHLRYESGKPNMNAILILAEILYWYKPIVVKDEVTGEILRYEKKFKADKLQKTYEALGDRFGLTKRQAKAACDFLKEKGLITVEFRTIELENGLKLSNVMYVEPIVENIKKISSMHSIHNVDPITLECNTLLHSNVTGYAPECKTNTKTTTKTTNKNKEIYISEPRTDVLNETKDNELIAEDSLEDNSPYQDSDIPDLDSNVNLPSLDKEALEVFSLFPRQDSDLVEFILEYRKLRFKYSKEYLTLIIDRYKKSKELKGENIYHKPENFFRCGEYKNYLDENWENTLDECNKIAAMRRQKPSAKKSGSNEPQVSCEWDQQLKDLDW